MTESDFTKDNLWMLPDGVDELLPPQSWALESLRRRVLDCFQAWGYELVVPPAIEFLDSLLTGVAGDLDLQTFKLTDQQSGRLMGVRADITPQAARIDAHQLRRDCPVRLCYLGTVLQARPEAPLDARNPVQVGAELYGHAGIESDVEIIALMLELLRLAGLPTPHLDLGHVGVFGGLARQGELSPEAEADLWDALQRKAVPEIESLLQRHRVASPVAEMLLALTDLGGGVEVLDQASARMAGAAPEVADALRSLWSVAGALERRLPDVPLHFDLGELRGYRYHTGIVFAALLPGHGREVARGGRYDHIGRVFGRPRPATGFSADLKALLELSGSAAAPAPAGVGAPWGDDPDLLAEVRRLREAGERVVWVLPGHEGELAAMGCDRRLVQTAEGWREESLN